jgi:hypothetical protein
VPDEHDAAGGAVEPRHAVTAVCRRADVELDVRAGQ